MLESFNLTGKIAVVTGGSRGIGKAIAEALSIAGARVIITGRNIESLDVSAKEIERKTKNAVHSYKCDINLSTDIDCLKRYILDNFGKLDIIVNNAGIVQDKFFLDFTDDEIDRMVQTNFSSVMKVTKQLGSILVNQKKGKIINLGSYDGIIGTPTLVPYGATKGGVIQFTRMLAVEWARYNININVICPGYIQTSMNEELFENKAILKKILNRIPLRRFGQAEEIGPLAVYLASKASDFVTGQSFVIDGGESIS